MMIRGTCAAMFAGGVMLWLMSKLVPFLQVMFMDYIAIFMMAGAVFILFFCFGLSQTGLQYDSIPPGTAIINYIRRDGIIQPLLGKRVFSGESFLDVPRLGIIEDLGKDTVFLWGKKKVRFGVENINYTPDPRYWNLCKELYSLGFDDTDDLYNVLNIPNIDANQEKAKKVYYLERMANIYWNITHAESRGGERLIKNFKERKEKNVSFGPRRKDTQKVEARRAEKTPSARHETQKATPLVISGRPPPMRRIEFSRSREQPVQRSEQIPQPIQQPQDEEISNDDIDEMLNRRMRENGGD